MRNSVGQLIVPKRAGGYIALHHSSCLVLSNQGSRESAPYLESGPRGVLLQFISDRMKYHDDM